MRVPRRVLLGAAIAGGASVVGLPLLAEAASTKRRVYLGSYTSEGGKGVGVGTLDPATGTLAVDHWVAGLTDPSWLDLAPDGKTLYAVSELDPTGKVSPLPLDGAGNPTVHSGQKTGAGPAHVRVHPNGKVLFTADYDGGSVGVYPLGSAGTIAPASQTVKQGGHPHQTVVDPTGAWVLTVNLGTDSVYVYRLDTTLVPHAKVKLRTGSGPRHLAFHPGGGYAYVAGETDSTVTVCAWRSGTLTPGTVVSTRPKPSTTVNNPGEIAVSADGRFVYVTNRGDNTVAVFGTSRGGAALRLLASPGCGGTEPRHLAIEPGGRWLYVANQRSNQVTWFGVDPSTGLLRKAGKVTAPAVSQVLIV